MTTLTQNQLEAQKRELEALLALCKGLKPRIEALRDSAKVCTF